MILISNTLSVLAFFISLSSGTLVLAFPSPDLVLVLHSQFVLGFHVLVLLLVLYWLGGEEGWAVRPSFLFCPSRECFHYFRSRGFRWLFLGFRKMLEMFWLL